MKPLLFDDREPAIPGESQYKDWPVWASWFFKAFLTVLAIVFFPVTLVLLWGYRTGRFTWGLGGHGGWEDEIDDEDDINWVRDHEERTREPPVV